MFSSGADVSLVSRGRGAPISSAGALTQRASLHRAMAFPSYRTSPLPCGDWATALLRHERPGHPSLLSGEGRAGSALAPRPGVWRKNPATSHFVKGEFTSSPPWSSRSPGLNVVPASFAQLAQEVEAGPCAGLELIAEGAGQVSIDFSYLDP